MRNAAVAAVMACLAVTQTVVAGEARREDAPRLLKEAVRTGTAEPGDFAAILDWVLHEKEERVASGFAEVLGALDLPASAQGKDGDRWGATTRAMVDVFAAALRDAQTHRARSGSDVPPELSALMRAAGPAIARSLREVDPASLSQLRAAVAVFGGAAGKDVVPDLVRALRHDDATVRRGAAFLLPALGSAARVAIPDLRNALGDADADVRAAARQALAQLGEK